MTTNVITEAAGPRAPAGAAVLQVDGLIKRYGDHAVVDGVSFEVRRGELFGLLGTNGAGKTTTVEILQGLRRASGGSVEVLGLDPAAAGDRLRRRIGSQLQDAALPARMRVGEALRLFASLHPDPRPLAELAEEWNLGELLGRPFAALSGGERQRLFVALALVGRPEVVFLDELTQNLDPSARRQTWDVVRRIRDRGTTVVLVTHDVEEAERLCDRVVVMHRGRVVADGSPTKIVEALGGAATVRFTDADLDVRPLRGLPGVASVQRHGPEVAITGSGPILAHVGAHLVAAGRPALDLRLDRPTLEDRFVALTQEDPS
jgi:ABC-2 type transport system ATP-binding protein